MRTPAWLKRWDGLEQHVLEFGLWDELPDCIGNPVFLERRASASLEPDAFLGDTIGTDEISNRSVSGDGFDVRCSPG